ncbi:MULTISPECIES: LPO_1073/Vpar_1526 family protein [unclassified Caulobacter]|uniref:LPO_1073/Vpar_1526 family protein n=1 Tax=unclassified Caulobacter TaxID=2648921 RepID=UPI000AC9A7CE|nr:MULTISPECIES: LPO_1073/Vpar_1526 family protein [unclassified Caulobacter]
MRSDQTTGDNSIAVVASGAVSIHTGVSVADVKEIFRDMMRDAMVGIQREALQEAEQRNEKLVDDLLSRAEDRFGEQIEEKLAGFKDPGAQYAFKQAQNGYCRYGDDEAKDNAIELILDRISNNYENDFNIIVDDAIEKAARLSERQVKILCLIFSIFSNPPLTISNLENFDKYVSYMAELSSDIPARESDISMLKIHGLLIDHSATRHWMNIDDIIRQRYWGIFAKGFDQNIVDFDTSDRDLFLPCLRNPTLMQANNVQLAPWRERLTATGLSDEKIQEIINICENSTMSIDEIKSLLDGKSQNFQNLRDDFTKEGSIKYSKLTTVGTAIAFSKVKRTGFYEYLSMRDLIA